MHIKVSMTVIPDSDSSGPRFVMQLKTRRRILAGQQLTIRYNSLLDVRFFKGFII